MVIIKWNNELKAQSGFLVAETTVKKYKNVQNNKKPKQINNRKLKAIKNITSFMGQSLYQTRVDGRY